MEINSLLNYIYLFNNNFPKKIQIKYYYYSYYYRFDIEGFYEKFQDEKNLTRFLNYLKKEEIDENLNSSYINYSYYYLTFFNENQITQIFNEIDRFNDLFSEVQSKYIKKYINYITNNCIIKLTEIIDNFKYAQNYYKSNKNIILETVNYFLNGILSKHYRFNFLRKSELKRFKRITPGFYLIKQNNDDLESQIINLSLYSTGNLPLSTTLMKCDENSTKNEVESFIYRYIICESYSNKLFNQPHLFILIGFHKLNEQTKEKIIEILDIFYNYNDLLFILENPLFEKEYEKLNEMIYKIMNRYQKQQINLSNESNEDEPNLKNKNICNSLKRIYENN